MSKALIKYFIDVSTFNIPFSIIIGVGAGFLWSIVSFATFGFLIGLLGFQFFRKNEYYAYYNLGYTKRNLAKKVWFINIGIVFLLLLVYKIIG